MIGSDAENALHVFLEVRPARGDGHRIPLPLTEARMRTARHLAQAAQECGARAELLDGNHREPHSPPAGHALWVRWGAGALLDGESICRLGLAARDGSVWGNRREDPDLWAFPAGLWPKPGSKPQKVFPPSAATLFRLATGGDLCLLAALGPQGLARADDLGASPAVLDHIRAVTRLLTKRTAELLVVGDPGTEGWRHLEQETACRVRLLADAAGGVLASLLASAGPAQFVRYLSELGDAFLVNTRILFADANRPAPQDFFQSDLGLVDRIAHRELRLLTEALLSGSRPVILGGSSLLTGGIYLLIERAWEGKDLPRQYETVPAPSAKQITKE